MTITALLLIPIIMIVFEIISITLDSIFIIRNPLPVIISKAIMSVLLLMFAWTIVLLLLLWVLSFPVERPNLIC